MPSVYMGGTVDNSTSSMGTNSKESSVVAGKNTYKNLLVASRPKGFARRNYEQLVSFTHGDFGSSVVGRATFFLLKVAALETVRRFSKSKCPCVWRGLQGLQILVYPPFKWIQRWAPFRGLVKSMQVLSRPLLVLSIATVFTDQPQCSDGTSDCIVDSPDSEVLKDGLSAVHVPYAYGFAIILLTVIVKAATLPLTKQQVESTLAMQNLQPKIKAIQERYAGNQERIQLETSRLYRQAGVNPLAGCLPTLATIPVWIGLYQALSNVANEGLLTEGFFWIPSLAGPTTIAARQSGAGISWLFPFVDGHPPLGWQDTAAYLALPILLVISQFVSMEIMKPPETDPSQKNQLLILKFLPLMIGYFSLSVPSGLTIYWFINNVLSTAQQVWLRKLGGAKPVVNENASGIITAGRAKRSDLQPAKGGERFKQLKEEEKKKKLSKALPVEDVQPLASISASDDGSDIDSDSKEQEVEEGAYASKVGEEVQINSREKRSKRSKRKRAV